jgi:hypothetical protein
LRHLKVRATDDCLGAALRSDCVVPAVVADAADDAPPRVAHLAVVGVLLVLLGAHDRDHLCFIRRGKVVFVFDVHRCLHWWACRL